MLPPELISALSGPAGALNLAELPLIQAVGRRHDTERTFTPVRVRFPREHEFFEDGDVHRQLYLKGILRSIREVEERTKYVNGAISSSLHAKSHHDSGGYSLKSEDQENDWRIENSRPNSRFGKVSEFRCQIAGCAQFFDTLESYEHHYNTLHRNVCSICKRSFPSARLLDIHILEWHDTFFQLMAEKENMYQCLVEGCLKKFKTSRERKDHLIKIHLYPSDFRFDKPQKIKDKTKQGSGELSMELGKESAVESMEICLSSVNESSRNGIAANSPGPSSLYSKCRVPRTICFGHGSVRGFKHPKKTK